MIYINKNTRILALKWYYDILGVSHRIRWKNKNAVYRLQISALVPELSQFKKYVKNANEIADGVIHSTQYDLKNKVELSWPVCSADHWNLAG